MTKKMKSDEITLQKDITFKAGTTIRIVVYPDNNYIVKFRGKGTSKGTSRCWLGGELK